MQWALEYYTAAGGKSPVKDFIDALSPESKAKFIFIADLLSEYGLTCPGALCQTDHGNTEAFRDPDEGPAEHPQSILFRVHREEAGTSPRVYKKDRQDTSA